MKINPINNNQNFKGLIKFNNVTINPNHIVKAETKSIIQKINIPVYTFRNSKDILDKQVKEQELRAKLGIKDCIRNYYLSDEVLINDPQKGLLMKTYNYRDKSEGLVCHFYDAILLKINGFIQLVNDKLYEFKDSTIVTQQPTAKEVNYVSGFNLINKIYG